ncbi:hypothetical protein D9M68_846460 [compost metagenome]
MAGVGQQLQPGQPIVRLVGSGPIQPLPDERPDIELFAVGFQQGINPVEQVLRHGADHLFLVGKVVRHRAGGAAGVLCHLAHRGPGVAFLCNHRDRGRQQFGPLGVVVADRSAPAHDGFGLAFTRVLGYGLRAGFGVGHGGSGRSSGQFEESLPGCSDWLVSGPA